MYTMKYSKPRNGRTTDKRMYKTINLLQNICLYLSSREVQ